MITHIARMVTVFLLKHNSIDESSIDIYQYGNEVIISSLIDVIIVIAIGVLFNELGQAVAFFITFFALRCFTGGYHANTYFKCKLVFVINILLVLCIIHQQKLYNIYSLTLICLFSVIVVFALAPIDNNNKPLTKLEKKTNSNKARFIVLSTTIIIYILYYYTRITSFTMLLALFSVTIAMIIEYTRKGGICNENSENVC